LLEGQGEGKIAMTRAVGGLWKRVCGWTSDLRERPYVLADTRVPSVSLYDHLFLTAGLAVVLCRELLARGRSAPEICGAGIPEAQLLEMARLCGWLHDIGKEQEGDTAYRMHVQRGIERAQELLQEHGVEEPVASIVIGAVARHHLRDQPQTLLEKCICLADSYASAGDRPELARADTWSDIEHIASPTLQLEEELFGDQKPLCLLLGDVDAIKKFVYETSALPEIRGGSEMLAALEDCLLELFRDELAREAVIYCGGGGFLAVVPAGEAALWKQRIESMYLDHTRIATITVVASEPMGYIQFMRGLPPWDNARVEALIGRGVAEDLLFSHFGAPGTRRGGRKNFGELVAGLSSRLQEQKRQKVTAPFHAALPVYRRCDSCSLRGAEKRDEVTGEWLCHLCQMKRDKGRGERRIFVREFCDWAKKHAGTEIPVNFPKEVGPGKFRFPQDLETLAGTDGKIAFLYADGNNVGDLLQRAGSPASYRHLSEALDAAMKESLHAALWKTFARKWLGCGDKPLPFEIIAAGGDDVLVIVRARYAWMLTIRLLEHFSRHPRICDLQNELRCYLTLAAGLVIADVKYPVRFLFRLAEDMLKRAKERARDGKYRESTLCHLWLRTAVLPGEGGSVLKSIYLRNSNGGARWLTARPFTVDQARRLTACACKLRMLSSSQRHALARMVELGVHTSLNWVLYQARRMESDQESRFLETLKELGDLVGGWPEDGDRFLFWRRKDDGVWRTAILDALELAELSAGRE